MLQQPSTATEQLDATFFALADPTRRAILARLAEGEASVTELTEPFDISQPAISRHLKVLQRAGLVSVGQDAQRRPRRLEPEPLVAATEWIERYQEIWERNFARLDALLEDLRKPERNPDHPNSRSHLERTMPKNSGSKAQSVTRSTPQSAPQSASKITPFLWFDAPLDQVTNYYGSIFDDFRVISLSPQTATFEIAGQRFHALNAGPKYKFTEAVSFFIDCEDQEEVDYYWERLTADGGEESMCGWLKDRYGLSWQVIPKALMRYLSDPDREKADRVAQAMLEMRKIDVAELDRAAAA